MNFYTLKEAATEIAAALYPADADDDSNDPRGDVQRRYLAALQNAVCENEIVYREPDGRLPIRQEGIAAYMTSHWCVVSVADLNAWLDRAGVGIRLAVEPRDETTHARQSATLAERANEWPKSVELASALGPFISRTNGLDWLQKRLSDAEDYPALKKYRRMEEKRRAARWNVVGVALYLVDAKELSPENARAALQKHYPHSVDLIGDLGLPKKTNSAAWYPKDND
ncbi:hypothetical protein [Burkholderia cepacia]|uniref:hypothetical protein n=1 Tax=Burkholderia cepacia TaxID=292 RepID=UPI00158FAB21|nr:hypothetical protein [Burkholderia cepacia]MBA9902678.1 hypothetical protein [Burkholderia cepacia]MBA9946551.1 hypothetical protein [Burkholderia cepacia]MBA9974348.1 hypothetical protein [Burkholderia cepacia]MBA9995299.1 hypothetical protein [Burkholderia cepacia]MBB0000754.1 hypothetical protein [Burkholderia cepacia]